MSGPSYGFVGVLPGNVVVLPEGEDGSYSRENQARMALIQPSGQKRSTPTLYELEGTDLGVAMETTGRFLVIERRLIVEGPNMGPMGCGCGGPPRSRHVLTLGGRTMNYAEATELTGTPSPALDANRIVVRLRRVALVTAAPPPTSSIEAPSTPVAPRIAHRTAQDDGSGYDIKRRAAGDNT